MLGKFHFHKFNLSYQYTVEKGEYGGFKTLHDNSYKHFLKHSFIVSY